MSRNEPGLILSRSRDRVGLLFGLCCSAAFMSGKSSALYGEVVTRMPFWLTGTDAERKAKADEIVASMGATARYEGGFYRASMPGLRPGWTTELLFVPPIPAPPGIGDDV